MPQAPDMWFQVELPQAAMMTEVQFDAGAPGGGGRGRGGRGRRRPRDGRGARSGAPAATAAAAPGAGAGPGAAPAAPQRGAAPGGGRGGAPVFGSFPIGYKVQLSMDGKTWGAPWPRATARRDDRRHVPSDAGEVREA